MRECVGLARVLGVALAFWSIHLDQGEPVRHIHRLDSVLSPDALTQNVLLPTVDLREIGRDGRVARRDIFGSRWIQFEVAESVVGLGRLGDWGWLGR